jgi:hypothetical protein
MMLQARTIAILIVLGLFCFSVAALDENFKKLGPESIVILTENGSGSARISFVRKAGVQTPQAWKLTDAVGTASSISEKDIKFQWTDSPPVSSQPDVVVGQISVDNTKTFIEPGVAYKGNLVLLREKDQPLTFEYTIQNSTSINFSLSPETPAIFLNRFQPAEIHFRVKNTGKSKITTVQYGLDIKNANNQTITTTQEDPGDINPGQEKEFTAAIPQPTLAGTYTGNLNVTANKSERKSISVSVQTRGPNFKGYWLPFVLFLIVLFLTWWLSTYLEEWFGPGGNLERAQAVLSFKKSQTDAAELARTLTQWEKDRPAKVPKTQAGLAELSAELALAIKNADATSSTDLKNEAQRFATEAMAKNIFLTVLQTATGQFTDPDKLKAVATKLDEVTLPYPLDLNGYRASLRKVLAEAITAEGLGGASSLTADVTKLSPEDIKAKIKRMAWLYRLAIGIVIFVTAYQTLYFPNKAFGTSIDYIVVFLWALGLTQTGKAIVAKVTTPK